jgi:ATP-independent RNA helicase DbpA
LSSESISQFSDFALSSAMLSNLAELGYVSPTDIQIESLPPILKGQDVIAQAKTGSGKTAAFGIPVLQALHQPLFAVQALVLCPTRELADQVAKELRRIARFCDNIKIITLCGGVAIGPQLGSLEHGAHIVVGTPGRVLKHLDKGSLVLDKLRTLILDEADRMLDMGFHDDIEHMPAKRQTLLFSATYPAEIRELSQRFQSDPVNITVESIHTENTIEQVFFEVDSNSERDKALITVLNHYQPSSAVIFCNTKIQCENTLQVLRGHGFSAQAIHGDLEQRERDQVIVRFGNGSCPILVATDVAARGLDIKELEAVINFELAFDAEVHIHRIGRTGRAGENGLALSLVAPAEARRATAIEDYLQKPLQWKSWQALQNLPKDSRAPSVPMVTLMINGGRKEKLRPGDILGALTCDAGIASSYIGKIDIYPMQAYVAIATGQANLAMKRLQSGKIKGRIFKVRLLEN